MGPSSSSSPPSKSPSSALLRFLLLAGVGMVAFCPTAAADDEEDKGDRSLVYLDCTHGGEYPYSGYKDDLKDAFHYLEENTGPNYSSVDAQSPSGNPGVYARSLCYGEPCAKCLRAAKNALFSYCPNRISGVVQLVDCSLYYDHYPF